MSPTKEQLLTPRDWAQEAYRYAIERCGEPEGERAMVEFRRYTAMANELERMKRRLSAAETMTEAQALALTRTLQELGDNLGLPDPSMEDIVAAVVSLQADAQRFQWEIRSDGSAAALLRAVQGERSDTSDKPRIRRWIDNLMEQDRFQLRFDRAVGARG